jgi:hypothetical protein
MVYNIHIAGRHFYLMLLHGRGDGVLINAFWNAGGRKMFENSTTLEVCPGAVHAVLRILRLTILPLLKQHPDLLGLCFLPDEAANQITVISLWSDEAAARCVEMSCAYRREIEKLDDLLPWVFCNSVERARVEAGLQVSTVALLAN